MHVNKKNSSPIKANQSVVKLGIREIFKITRLQKKYDHKTGTYKLNISYKTRTDVTDRTIKVAEAFGIGVDNFQEHVIYDNVELKIAPNDIVYITGDSGSGKSVLLKALEKNLQQETVNLDTIKIDPDQPLIDSVGGSFDEGLTLLSRVGLNDAFLFVRRYSQLSDGQKYRYRLAKMIESDKNYWFADEFCSTLDRDTAKIVSFNIQKIAREEGRAVFAATTHTDLFDDLKPSIHIHKRFGKEIQVNYYPNNINKECSIKKEMHIKKGTRSDYKKLAHFHYRDSRIFAHHKIFVMKRETETVGAIVYSSPPLAVTGRRQAIGKKMTIQEINNKIIRISRVVIHPKYRTIGLGAKIVKETLPLAEKPYVETIAVMAKYNPFFEKAGMNKIAQTTPNPQVIKAVEKLRKLNFNPVFLTSEKTNQNKLQQMTQKQLNQVKEAIKEITGIYRKRIASTKQAFLNKKDYEAIVDAADINKLAKMIRILGFLTQTKVYLFWKRKPKNEKNT
ncbi:MAG: ABC transporter ATP-binding protein [Candidatus Bathyarchaeum sp.]|nr:MAG: ABC transporter ATP-binding protein [Candidatus Bathyarchaeum sp.]